MDWSKPTFVNYFIAPKKGRGFFDVSFRSKDKEPIDFPWMNEPSDCIWMIPPRDYSSI